MPRLGNVNTRLLGLSGLASALLIGLGVALTAPPAHAAQSCEAEGAVVRITVDNVRSSDGLVTAALYNNEPEVFLSKKGRLERVRVEAQEGQTVICVVPPGPGTYAIAVYHDENHSKKLDRNFLGIPKEGFGFSNNPKIGLGPPEHEEVKFTLNDEPYEIEISLIYL